METTQIELIRGSFHKNMLAKHQEYMVPNEARWPSQNGVHVLLCIPTLRDVSFLRLLGGDHFGARLRKLALHRTWEKQL